MHKKITSVLLAFAVIVGAAYAAPDYTPSDHILVGTSTGNSTENVTEDLEDAIDYINDNADNDKKIVLLGGRKLLHRTIVTDHLMGLTIEGQGYGEFAGALRAAGTIFEWQGDVTTGNTCTVVSGVVTLSDATPPFPDWIASEGGELFIGGKYYDVDTRDSDTQVTLVDTSFSSGAGTNYTCQLYRSMFVVAGVGTRFDNLCFWGHLDADTSTTGTITVVDGVATISTGTFPSWSGDDNVDIQVGTADDSWYDVDPDATTGGATTITFTDTSSDVDFDAGTTYVLRHNAPERMIMYHKRTGSGLGTSKARLSNLWFSHARTAIQFGEAPDQGNDDSSVMDNVHFQECRRCVRLIDKNNMGYNIRNMFIFNDCEDVFYVDGGGHVNVYGLICINECTVFHLLNTSAQLGRNNGYFAVYDLKKDNAAEPLTLVNMESEALCEIIFHGAKYSAETMDAQEVTLGTIQGGCALKLENNMRIGAGTLGYNGVVAGSPKRQCRVTIRDCQFEDEVVAPDDIIDSSNATGRLQLLLDGNFYENKRNAPGGIDRQSTIIISD